MTIKNANRPKATKEFILARWPECKLFTVPILLGVRGYHILEGRSKENRRGIYDDAIFLISDNFASFNANCDPSEFKVGTAVLQTGVYQYKLGLHNRNAEPPRKHLALVQNGPVYIRRDGLPFPQEGHFGINIHRGGRLQTGSHGCQTIPSDQWDEFITLIKKELDEKDLMFIFYKLIEVKNDETVRIQSI